MAGGNKGLAGGGGLGTFVMVGTCGLGTFAMVGAGGFGTVSAAGCRASYFFIFIRISSTNVAVNPLARYSFKKLLRKKGA